MRRSSAQSRDGGRDSAARLFGLSPWYMEFILGVMTAIQQIENSVLVPRIVGALDLHPIA